MPDSVKGVKIDPVREKLIELLDGVQDYGFFRSTAEEPQGRVMNRIVAEFLIANGVTVLTGDEVKNIYTAQQIEEIQNEAYDLGVDSALHHKFGLSWDDAAGLRKEIKRLQDATKWIPVTERLPQEGEDVLVIGYWHEKWQILMCYLSPHRKEEWYTSDAGQQIYSVTHWMPLPQPPKEGCQ